MFPTPISLSAAKRKHKSFSQYLLGSPQLSKIVQIKTIILHVALYGYKVLSLVQRIGHTGLLRIFQNLELRKTFLPKTE